MNQKKQLSVALLALAATLALTACGGGAANETGDAEKPADENAGAATSEPTPEAEAPKAVSITAQWPKPDNPVFVQIYEEKLARFLEAYPHVTVDKNDWQYAPNEIGIKMAAQQAPSFFQTFATEGKTLVGRGWAADLTPYLADYPHAADLNPTLMEAFQFDGKTYAIPDSAYIMTVTINKKLFEANGVPLPTADWSWDEFYEAAKATTDASKGIAGFAIMAKGNEGGWNWTNLLYQAGGEAQKVEGGKVVSTFQSEAGVKAMEFLKKLRWEANALPQNWALNYADTYNLFKQGRAAMVLGNAIENAVNTGGMSKDDLLMLPMPSMEKGGDHIGILGGQYYIVNPQESPEAQRAAFDYVTMDLFKDSGLEALKKDLEERKAKGQVKAPNVAEYWKPDSEYGKKVQALYDQYPETIFHYDPQTTALAKGAPEPAYNAQDYYAAITNVMQEVLTDENADVKALLEAAAAKFDTEVLSQAKVE
jgi:ABC-type glycerol-3-phosphate transport system substrate-binding protein